MKIDFMTASREELISGLILSQSSYSELERTSEDNYKKLEAKYTRLEKASSRLEEIVAWLQRQLFGVKSERQLPQDVKQLSLFEEIEEAPASSVTIKQYERLARKTPTDVLEGEDVRFEESVPVEEIIILPEEVKDLAESEYEVIGEKITTRLKQIPCTYSVVRTIRKTVKIKDTQKLLTAPAPEAVIDRSYADVSLLVGLVVDKFQYHQPLYRQHQKMKINGVHVSRSNLTKLVHRTVELLDPIYYSILSEIQQSETVAMDETPIKAGRKEHGKMKTAYFWPVYAGEQVAFVYSSSRGHETIQKVLGSGCKKLMSDGYSAYEKYAKDRGDLIHAQCWAHARRKFFESGSPESEKILEIIRRLFKIEEELRQKEPEDVLRKRRYESLPLVDECFLYLKELQYEKLIDKDSLLGKAVYYSLQREEGLRFFLEHADLPLSNNQIENQIRPVALGRKNWLFCWSEVGARYAAVAYTFIQCCKIQGINPWNYLADVLVRIDSHPACDVHLLTPKNWKNKFGKNINNAS